MAKGLVLSALLVLLRCGRWVSGAGFDLVGEGKGKTELGQPCWESWSARGGRQKSQRWGFEKIIADTDEYALTLPISAY